MSLRTWPVLSLRTWLVLSHVFVLVLPVAVLVGSGALSSELRAQTEEDLETQATLVGLLATGELEQARLDHPAASLGQVGTLLNPTLRLVKNATLASVRVTDATGKVIATSGEELGEDLSDRPEVREALAGTADTVTRPREAVRTAPLNSKSRRSSVRMFHATPIWIGDERVGVVVLSRTPKEEVQALYQLVPRWGTALAIAITLLLANGAAFIFTRSLRNLSEGAREVSERPFAPLDVLVAAGRSHVSEVSGLSHGLAAMARRLQDRLRYISEFAGNVAHEFRGPITSVRGGIELIREDDGMPPEQRAKFLDNALAELTRLERLVTGLLALARADEARNREPVDVDAVVRAAVGPVAIRGGAARAVGDEAQLASVATNLVNNALRHGGPGVAVEVVLFATASETGFSVIDNGPGIDEANLPRVFDRFFTTARDSGGTGLGLALTRAIVEAHGGSVSVSSRPGETAFRVVLPRSA
jgi:signal transduction histidine kinase